MKKFGKSEGSCKHYVDVSLPLSNELPVWPGTKKFQIRQNRRIRNGDNVNESSISCNLHTGTHIDAPLHFIENEKSIDQIAPDDIIGMAYVAYIPEINIITAEILTKLKLPRGIKRLLLKTDNSLLWKKNVKEFKDNFVAMDDSAARWLVKKSLKVVGIDYLSIETNNKKSAAHKILMENDTVIIEGLDLSNVDQGNYHLICLPLLIKNAEAAPARVVLRKEQKI